MIKIVIAKEQLVIHGHAGFDEYGKDVVCASVSSIVITTVNGILRLCEDGVCYQVDDDKMTITVLKKDHVVKVLLDNMVSLLEQLESQYPDYVEIKK